TCNKRCVLRHAALARLLVARLAAAPTSASATTATPSAAMSAFALTITTTLAVATRFCMALVAFRRRFAGDHRLAAVFFLGVLLGDEFLFLLDDRRQAFAVLRGDFARRFGGVHLLAAVDHKGLGPDNRLAGVDGDVDAEALFQRAQMAALLI